MFYKYTYSRKLSGNFMYREREKQMAEKFKIALDQICENPVNYEIAHAVAEFDYSINFKGCILKDIHTKPLNRSVPLKLRVVVFDDESELGPNDIWMDYDVEYTTLLPGLTDAMYYPVENPTENEGMTIKFVQPLWSSGKDKYQKEKQLLAHVKVSKRFNNKIITQDKNIDPKSMLENVLRELRGTTKILHDGHNSNTF